MVRPSGLGRGLGALLSSEPHATPQHDGGPVFAEVAIDAIMPTQAVMLVVVSAPSRKKVRQNRPLLRLATRKVKGNFDGNFMCASAP